MIPKTRCLGLWTLTSLVCGNMIGSGIFLLPSSLAKFGSVSLLSWIFTGFGAMLIGLVLARLAVLMPRIGGPYAYCESAFGDYIGFQIAYGYWISMWVGNAAIVIAFVGYLGVFFPSLTQNHLLSFSVAVLTVWFLTFVNIRGVRGAGFVQLVTTVLKLSPLLFIVLFCLPHIHLSYLHPFNLTQDSNLNALTQAATLTLWAFIGLESATIPADNVENPKRNIPRATIYGISIATLLYILSSAVVMLVVPNAQLRESCAPFADAANMIMGHWGKWFVAAGAAISCFGTLNGWILMQGQIPLAAAKDKLFPEVFGKLTRGGVPYIALIISSVLISGLLLFTLNENLIKQFTNIILLATLSGLIPYFFSCMAELIFLVDDPKKVNPKRFGISSIISVLGGLYAYWAIIGSGKDLVFYGTLLILSAAPLYVWAQWHKRGATT